MKKNKGKESCKEGHVGKKNGVKEMAIYNPASLKAEEFINEHFAAFKKTLAGICKKYGINRQVNYHLYVTPFSTGRMYVGNTYEFDSADADALVDFISDGIEGNDTGVLGRIFGNS